VSEPLATGPAPTFELVVCAAPIEDAGHRIAECLRGLARDRGAAELRLAIPGGSALAAVVRAAAELGELWRRVALIWVDERCVPVADAASNRGEALRAGLLGPAGDATADGSGRDALRAPDRRPARVIPLFEDGETPEAAVARVARCYADQLAGGLDVAVLGMGADGHVASLFPDRPTPPPGDVAFVPDAPKAPPRRITLTRPALATARHTLLVATGEEKRDALERLRTGDPRLAATGLPGLVVVTDLVFPGAPAPERMRR
jgi:6-phosphogluconolactonase